MDDKHKHGAHCGHNCAHDHSEMADKGSEYSLYRTIDTSKVRCLNTPNPSSAASIFKPAEQKLDTTKFLESNTGDSRLILYVPFTGTVKLKSFILIGGEGGMAPAHVKVFTNRDDIDFDNVDRAKSVQEWDLAEDSKGVIEYPTKLVKFSAVQNLTFYFDKNWAANKSRIYYLAMKGDFTPLSRQPVITAYELRPQPSDHKQKSDTMGQHQLGM